MEHTFSDQLKIIGINPYVSIPNAVLNAIFADAGKDKGPIPICGTVNGKPYVQTLVKYAGEWRLYINMIMLAHSPKRLGEIIEVTVTFDPKPRTIDMHPMLKAALVHNEKAQTVFDRLTPSRQKEIVRYISHLKTDEKIKENVEKAIGFLLGKQSFAGREKP